MSQLQTGNEITIETLTKNVLMVINDINRLQSQQKDIIYTGNLCDKKFAMIGEMSTLTMELLKASLVAQVGEEKKVEKLTKELVDIQRQLNAQQEWIDALQKQVDEIAKRST